MKKTIMAMTLIGTASFAQASVSVSDCVIQEVIPPKNMTGAFMTITNDGEESVDIISAALPTVTDTVELHEMKVEDNVMIMQEITAYTLTPGVHEFKKGGYHVMLMDITTKPQVGEQHTLTLNLSDGTSIGCEAIVLSLDEVMATYQHNGAHAMHEMHHTNQPVNQSMKEMDMPHYSDESMTMPHEGHDAMPMDNEAAVGAMPHHGQANAKTK